jgi:hypothetical protein
MQRRSVNGGLGKAIRRKLESIAKSLRATGRVGPTPMLASSQFPHRAEGYNFLALLQWMDPAMTERCIPWTRETYQQMQPFAASGRYVNYLDDDEPGGPGGSCLWAELQASSRAEARSEKLLSHEPEHPPSCLKRHLSLPWAQAWPRPHRAVSRSRDQLPGGSRFDEITIA